MALIKCVECANQVSDLASTCPHCGAPVAATVRPPPPRPAAPKPQKVGPWLRLGVVLLPPMFALAVVLHKSYGGLRRTLALVWLGCWLSAVGSNPQLLTGRVADPAPAVQPAAVAEQEAKQPSAAAVAEPQEPGLPEYTAGELSSAYEQDSESADRRFKGQRYRVKGVVAGINTDMSGNAFVTLRGGVSEYREPQFNFDTQHAEYATQLQPGMQVSLVCRGLGDVSRTPMSRECQPAG